LGVRAWRKDFPKWVADNTAPFFVPETSPAMMQWIAALTGIPAVELIPGGAECRCSIAVERYRKPRGISLATASLIRQS
jgi:hypothetical protein